MHQPIEYTTNMQCITNQQDPKSNRCDSILAYANGLTDLLLYPKSRDAIASKTTCVITNVNAILKTFHLRQ